MLNQVSSMPSIMLPESPRKTLACACQGKRMFMIQKAATTAIAVASIWNDRSFPASTAPKAR